MKIGHLLMCAVIALPAGVTATQSPDLTVVRVAAPKVEAEPEPAAGAAVTEPEVIKEKKEEPAAAAGAAAKPGDKAAEKSEKPEKK